MKPTLTYIKQRFDEFNEQMFGGQLPVPPMQMSRARTFVAQCAARRRCGWFGKSRLYDFRLKFSVHFDLPENEWEDVIIHEMIHYHIGVNNLRDTSSHGKLFRQMMNEINARYGRKITVSHRSTSEEKDRIYASRRKEHIVALVHFADGRRGIKILPRSEQRINAYRTALLRNPRISSIDVFYSTAPYFNRFPCSSAFNVIMADEQEFMQHINNVQTTKPLTL